VLAGGKANSPSSVSDIAVPVMFYSSLSLRQHLYPTEHPEGFSPNATPISIADKKIHLKSLNLIVNYTYFCLFEIAIEGYSL
jgi:hypothetical protein